MELTEHYKRGKFSLLTWVSSIAGRREEDVFHGSKERQEKPLPVGASC